MKKLKLNFLKLGGLFLSAMLIGAVQVWAQNPGRAISGTVTSDGQPQAGVTVIVKGTQHGAVTDAQGRWSIPTVKPTDVLVFSSFGMVPQEITVGAQTSIEVVLVANMELLDEVVVVGYGTRKRSDLTGSMDVIGEENIRKTPAANIGMALQGMGSGVQISRSGASTHPAHTPEIRIRGTRSIAAGNDPLLVVDGIPYDVSLMNNIAPDDITSVNVLKDASSTAIYGSRGANGVILITTKRGNKEAKPTVQYNGYIGFSKALGEYDMMNAEEYMEMRKWAIWNRFPGDYSDFNDQALIDKVFEFGFSGEIKGYQNGLDVNWQREIFQKTPVVTNHQVGVSGGTANTQYAASMGYYNSTGIFEPQSMERMTAKISVDQTVGKHILLGFNSMNTYYISRGESVNPMEDALRLSPILSPYEADGSIRQKVHANDLMSNPLMDLRPGAIQDDRKRLSSFNTGYLEVDFTHGFKYRLNGGIQISPATLQRYYQSGTSKRRASSSYGANMSNSYVDWTLEHLLTWDKQVGKHNFNVTGMFSSEEQTAQKFGIAYENVLTNDIGYYNPALGENHKAIVDIKDNNNSRSFEKWSLLSYMGRVNYIFDNRFYVTATLRADGSSRLATGNKWHYFPSAALAWTISNERFMESAKNVLSQLKLRLSYGETGNTNVNPYATMGGMTSNKYIFGSEGVLGFYPNAASNYDLRWERTATYNAGLDFGFLNNRITGSVEFYKQFSRDLMMNFTPPATNGVTSSIPYNVGKTQNYGFEFSVRAQVFNGNGRDTFRWTSDFNIFLNRNKVVALTEGVDKLINDNLFVGHPLNSFYEYRGLGLWQDTPEDRALAESFGLATTGANSWIGRIKIADISGPEGVPDGVLNSDDREVVGSHQAKFEGGWTNTLEWRGFDLSLVMYFRYGGLLRSDLYGGNMNSLMGGYFNNLDVDYYTPDNPDARWPLPNNLLQSIDYKGTLTLFDASYLKIRSVTLGYSLPDKLLSRIGVGQARVYATATNPFTFFSEYVNKYNGLDPETNRTIGAVVPPQWQMLFGINLTF